MLKHCFGALLLVLVNSACQDQTIYSSVATAPDAAEDAEILPVGAEQGLSIFGGVNAGKSEFPFMAALVNSPSSGDNYQDQYCGGTLIDPQFVLTAAHCVEGTLPAELNILLGTNVLNKNSGTRFAVTAISMHPQYNKDSLENDIALIKLARRADQFPVAALGNLGPAGSDLTIVGWGAVKYLTNPDGSLQLDEEGKPIPAFPRKLKKAEVRVISTEVCNRPAWLDGKVKPGMFCAGYRQGGIDTCSGDSGGPTLRLVKGKYQVVGITSWGEGCAEAKAPGVYTQVDRYLGYIHTARFMMRQN